MNWFRVCLINVVVFALLIFAAEAILRLAWTAKSCFVSTCDTGRLAFGKIYNFPKKYASTSTALQYHSKLGYVPRAPFDAVMSGVYWGDRRLTINEDGFRENSHTLPRSSTDILVVGDSFAFGDQVSNDETWPACLQKSVKRRVDNAGVTGYGGAQSFRRALIELEKRRYSDIVLSVVVGDDFLRDRMNYKWGRPRPAVVEMDGQLNWASVSNPDLLGTVFNPIKPNPFIVFFYERSMLAAFAIRYFTPQWVFRWATFEQENPDAASKNRIIDWTLRGFKNLPVPRKILLLQYWDRLHYEQYLDYESALKERDYILRLADELQLTVVDTYDVLRNETANLIWDVHHTPHGNNIICQHLVDSVYR